MPQGKGVRPANRLLRSVLVCSPPGRHLCSGGRLEDCERRGRRPGVCVGDQDGSEAVGNAQQVGNPQHSVGKCQIFCDTRKKNIFSRNSSWPLKYIFFSWQTLSFYQTHLLKKVLFRYFGNISRLLGVQPEGLACFCYRHPVRHVRFNSSTLLTANIPDDKSPRGACITDDDLTAHRRS